MDLHVCFDANTMLFCYHKPVTYLEIGCVTITSTDLFSQDSNLEFYTLMWLLAFFHISVKNFVVFWWRMHCFCKSFLVIWPFFIILILTILEHGKCFLQFPYLLFVVVLIRMASKGSYVWMSDLCVNVYTCLWAKESKVSYPSCEARPEEVSRTHGKCRPLTMDNLNFNSITH